MKSLNYLQRYSFLAFAGILLLSAFAVNDGLNKPLIVVSKQDQTWNLNGKMVQNFHLGLKRFVSSFLWISTILESDIDHYKKKDLNSWMFLRFKTISELDPRFYENYVFGGMYLSIVKDDLAGASVIYNRGLEYYSNDYVLLRDAGFHFYFELEDLKRSYEVYTVLKKNPRADVKILATLARLESNKGNLDSAFELLILKYNEIKDKESFFAKKLHQNLYAIKAEIDTNCLNSNVNKKNCSLKDFENNKYIFMNEKFIAKKPWTSFRVKGKRR
jgi:hypothetical protein